MILDSGYIEIKKIVSEKPLQFAWSEKLACHITTSTHNHEGTYKDGEFTASAYMVFLPFEHKKELPNRQLFKVRLTSNNNEDLGVFETQRVELLTVRQRIKIVV